MLVKHQINFPPIKKLRISFHQNGKFHFLLSSPSLRISKLVENATYTFLDLLLPIILETFLSTTFNSVLKSDLLKNDQFVSHFDYVPVPVRSKCTLIAYCKLQELDCETRKRLFFYLRKDESYLQQHCWFDFCSECTPVPATPIDTLNAWKRRLFWLNALCRYCDFANG